MDFTGILICTLMQHVEGKKTTLSKKCDYSVHVHGCTIVGVGRERGMCC